MRSTSSGCRSRAVARLETISILASRVSGADELSSSLESSSSSSTMTSRNVSSSSLLASSVSSLHSFNFAKETCSTLCRASIHEPVFRFKMLSYSVYVWRICATTASCTRRAKDSSLALPTRLVPWIVSVPLHRASRGHSLLLRRHDSRWRSGQHRVSWGRSPG